MTSKKRNILMISESEHSSNMRYFSGFKAPDPFICASVNSKKYILVSPLEYGRAQKESAADEVINTADIKVRGKKKGLAETFHEFSKNFKIRTFEVPPDFPLSLAETLKKKKLVIRPGDSPFLPQRQVKTDSEVDKIKQAILAAEKAMAAVERILKKSKITRRRHLKFKGTAVTSEFMQKAVLVELARNGASSENPIVAGGIQACDPHCSGNGPLKADEFIVVDIFPKNIETGYYGDITRTFLKGSPSSAQEKLYKTVLQAQKKALSVIKAGTGAKKVHEAAAECFRQKGYETALRGDTLVGFIHSTGHSFGLDIHELPGLNSKTDCRLKQGNIITVEPGLYYPHIGGVRIEDDVLVTKRGGKVLTAYHKKWVIR